MTSKIDYTGNGSIVAFPFPFAIPAKSALEVRVNDAVRDIGFHVVGAGGADGGTVIFDNAPANGDAVSLRYLGAVTIGVQDAAAGHLAEKLIAGANITLDTVTEDGGVQRLRITGTDIVDALEKPANLSDLADKAAARGNLGVYSKAETDALDQAVRDAALLKAGNLAGLTDVAAARSNLGVYSKAETDVAAQAVRDVALLKANNLSDLPNKMTARENLGVASAADTTTAIATAVSTLSDQVLHRDQNLNDVASKATARTNLEVYSTTEADGAFLAQAANLGDVADVSQARDNLGVASAADTTTAIATAVSTLSYQVLHRDQNLNDVASKATARTNLEVYSKDEVTDAFLAKAANLGDVDDAAIARTNLGLDQVAYLNVAQDWTKPQRSQALSVASVGGSVVLDFAQAQNFDLTLNANVTFANPTLSAAVIGQKGTIGIVPATFSIAGMGSQWKRVGEIGWPSAITGIGRIDYHIRALDRIEYAYNDVEA